MKSPSISIHLTLHYTPWRCSVGRAERRRLVKRHSYREQDHAFGQLMLALRIKIGLTQAGLAELLGVSRHAVGGWEAGQSYPKANHLKRLIELGVQHQAFTSGQEAEDIRVLWRAARQKIFLDERWLEGLLKEQPSSVVVVEQTGASRPVGTPLHESGPQVDWSDAFDVSTFYGRDEERALLRRWLVDERCRVVSLLGMGGLGKSSLAVTVMHELAAQFDVVIWRSVRDTPACEVLLDDCLQVLTLQSGRPSLDSLEGRLLLLIEQMRQRRVLLVLDNLEVLLEESTGRMGAGAEGYARLLRRIGETAHRSCLLLTSREKPAELVPLEGNRSLVRSLRLGGIDAGAGARLLAEKDVVGSSYNRARLVEMYRGNPLALKIVAQTIVELFGGEIAAFLEQGEVIFGGVRQLLDEQFARLSAREQTVLYWLAILREPTRLEELGTLVSTPVASAHLLEGLDGLSRRSLVERAQRAGSFTLQSVVLEYVTARLVGEVSSEIEQGKLAHLITYAFCQAQARDYVRRTQEQLFLLPILTRLQSIYQGQAEIEMRLLALLDQLRNQQAQGYGPANILALLRLLRGDLRSLDLSGLALRGVHLQGVDMQDTRLSGAVVQDSVFTEAFDDILAVAISSTGDYWAAASRRGEIRIWGANGLILRQTWRAHTDMVWTLAFSPDGRTLASGSWDGTFKLWDVASGALRWGGRHADHMHHLAFAPDGRTLATSGPDATVRLWDAQNGTPVHTLPHPHPVLAMSWSPDGQLLLSGDQEGSIRFWEVQQTVAPVCIRTLPAHAGLVDGLAIAPDGRTLASGSWDGTVKLWDMADGGLQRTLTGHTDNVRRVVWSPDGSILASCGFEKTIWLWSVEQENYRAALQEHSAPMTSLAFTPDNRSLLSSSEDGTVRVWDVPTRQCLRVMQGYVSSLYDIGWSPDGSQLASGGTDRLVMIHSVAGGTPPRALDGESSVAFGIGWSPDGHTIASSEWLNLIRLWNLASGTCEEVIQHPDDSGNYFHGVAWSPDGQRLASGTARHGAVIWDMTTRRLQWAEEAFSTWIRPVSWSPDGTYVAGGGDDGAVYVWDSTNGTIAARLPGHQAMITSVAWSANGTRLASGGRGSENGELFVWDVRRWERIHPFAGPPEMVAAVAWGANENILISGGSDGHLRWWDVQRGECVWVRQAHQGNVHAIKVSPDGSRVASCGDDGAILLWNIHTGEQFQTLRRDRPYERVDITGLTGISDAQRMSLIALGAIDGREISVTRDDIQSLPAEALAPPANDVQPKRVRPDKALGLVFQPTTFVGRNAELTSIATWLANPACRLLTLLGPGGMGKTRLAVEVASAQHTAFPDGVAFVSLASIDTPSQIAPAIAETLSLIFSAQLDHTTVLVEYLREREMLLVLDNFEHVLEGADLVYQILERAPRVTILVTSRARLDLQAEWLFDVDGLAYPQEEKREPLDADYLAKVTDYSAVQLFVQRATQVQSSFAVTEATLASLVRICQHVAGMPLAIELAAAGIRSMAIDEIEQQISANLNVLSTTLRDVPARHRSMRAVFDHSWNLLNQREQTLLSYLAVFRGGFSVEAAEQVADATVPMLTALVDKSLVRQNSSKIVSASNRAIPNTTAELRFTLLEPIREYALYRLTGSPDAQTARQRHAHYFTALAEAITVQWDSPTAGAAIKQLDEEHDNLRAVLQWAKDGGDRTVGLRLAIALRRFWQRRGYYREGRVWLEELFTPDDVISATPATIRARALHTAAWLASDQHDFARAATLFEQSLLMRRAAGETEREAHLLLATARQARVEGRYPQAIALFEEALAQHRSTGNRGSASSGGLGQSLYDLALIHREQGNFERAEALLEEGIAFHREIGEREGEVIGLLGLSDVARDKGNATQLRAYAEECLTISRELGIQWAIGFTLNNLALAAYLEGSLTQAYSIANQSLSLFRSVHADGSTAEVLITLGHITRAQGDTATAHLAMIESVRLAKTVGPQLMTAAALEGLAGVVIHSGQAAHAVQFLAHAAMLREQMGTPVRPMDRAMLTDTLESARSILGPDSFATLWAKARDMSLEQLLSTIPRVLPS